MIPWIYHANPPVKRLDLPRGDRPARGRPPILWTLGGGLCCSFHTVANESVSRQAHSCFLCVYTFIRTMATFGDNGGRDDTLAQNSQPLLSRDHGKSVSTRVSDDDDKQASHGLRPYQGSSTSVFWQLSAISGILALVTATACVGASLAILLKSDGAPVSRWPIQPSVYLAIGETICSTMLRYALRRLFLLSGGGMPCKDAP